MGPLSVATIKGGKRLENALFDIAKKLGTGATLKVGFLANATYPDGTPVAMIAAIQNFGAPKVGIPPRPYFDNFVKDNKSDWPKTIRHVLKISDYDVPRTLTILGIQMKGQLQEAIANLYDPPLSPVTLMLRKMRSQDQSLVVTGSTVAEARRRVANGESTAGVSTKPLEDSKHMLQSVDYEIN